MLVESLSNICEEPELSQLRVKQLLDAVALMGDEMLILDIHSATVLWCSSSFAQRFGRLCDNKGFEELYITFPGLRDRIKQKQDQTAVKARPVFVASQNCFYDVVLSEVKAGILLLRFHDLSKKASETKRYLEDREQLFSMSRSLSVSEMATTLAHELNQPIGTLMNLLNGVKYRLSTNQKPSEDILKALELAQQQTKFASSVIARVRDYTRSRQPEYQTILISELVNSSVSLLDWEIQRDDTLLEVNSGDDMGITYKVDGDYVMLQQVLVNLLRNALDAVREAQAAGERRIKIRVRDDGDFVDVAIQDNGVGLSKDGEGNLFVPFSSTKPNGMGIGLNICRSFVELHQGKLWLSSLDEGGCAAHILLPKKSERQ